jgi:hypothetical protein
MTDHVGTAKFVGAGTAVAYGRHTQLFTAQFAGAGSLKKPVARLQMFTKPKGFAGKGAMYSRIYFPVQLTPQQSFEWFSGYRRKPVELLGKRIPV